MQLNGSLQKQINWQVESRDAELTVGIPDIPSYNVKGQRKPFWKCHWEASRGTQNHVFLLGSNPKKDTVTFKRSVAAGAGALFPAGKAQDYTPKYATNSSRPVKCRTRKSRRTFEDWLEAGYHGFLIYCSSVFARPKQLHLYIG